MADKKNGSINVGLIGFGNIGTGVVKALNTNAEVIEQRIGVPLRITRICDIDTKRKRDAEYDPAIVTSDANQLLDDPNIHVIVEVMGGLEPARTFAEKALRNGKHFVTANKAMLASYGVDLWRIADETKAALLFEASVGGGIPVIRALQLGLSANRIKSVYGIVNGTCNFILTHMAREHKAFQTVLAEAQSRGFAEPDPTFDVEGYDTAHKTAVLASLAFQQDIRYSDVFVEGISRLKRVDMENAKELGYVIKLLGIAKADEKDGRVEVRVHPTLLPKESLLGNVNEVFNGIMIEGDLVGRSMYYGRGAGQDPTASAVVSDIMSIANDIVRGAVPSEHRMKIQVGSKNLKPIAELQTSYYVRIEVADRPGSMAQLSTALANHNVSIKSMIQKSENTNRAELIIVTHKAVEKDVQEALKEISAMDITFEQPFVLRVEEDL